MRQLAWSASLICLHPFYFKETLALLQESIVKYLHVDVMDGRFVPRLGMYPEIVEKIKEVSSLPIEVHLMVENPENYFRTFAKAGADIVTIHLETCRDHLLKTLDAAHSMGLKIGVALNPATEFVELEWVKDRFEFLLLMGIHPGILGQSLKPMLFSKIKKYRELGDFKIIIDGGVSFENAALLFDAGADILVGGSQTIFQNSPSLKETLLQLDQL